jgi:iron complex transport system permease protein
MFIGADNRYLIPASALFGGMLMIVADQIGRVALSTPLPVGVVMSFIGGPVFIWLILRKSKNVW